MNTLKRILATFSIAALAAAAGGCGGGGGSAGDGGAAGGSGGSSAVVVSGTASAPTRQLAMFERKSFLASVADLIVAGAHAGIAGLQAVGNATVELIRVDNNGEQVGAVLATTFTSSTGEYSLTLPAGTDLAANLVVRITGNSSQMRAQVVSQTVNIDPVSEFVLQKLVKGGAGLDTLATNEVIRLRGRADQFDLTAGADLTEMLVRLDAHVGQYLEHEVAAIRNGSGDAGTVASDYHTGNFSLELQDMDDHSIGWLGAVVELSTTTVTDAGSGRVSASDTAAESLGGLVNFHAFGSPPTALFVSTAVDAGGGVASGIVDGSGAVVIDIPFSEGLEIEHNTGFRFPPNVLRLEPVGPSGFYIGRDSDAAVKYSLTDTNGDATPDALDPNAKLGDDVQVGITVLARESTGLSNASLSGAYGLVGMAMEANNARGVLVEGFFAVHSFDGLGNVAETVFDAVAVERSAGGASLTVSTDTETANFTYSVDADGRLTTDDGGGSTTSGFVADGGNVLVAFPAETVGTQPNVTAFYNGLVMGVKLPTSAPELGGRSYRLFSLELGYAGAATAVESLADGRLAFNGDGTVSITGLVLRGVERGADTTDVSPINETVPDIGDQAVIVGANGGIEIAPITDAEGSHTLKGFVSADGGLLVLRSRFSGTSGNDEAIGMVVGIPN